MKPMMRLNITDQLEPPRVSEFPWGQPFPAGWKLDLIQVEGPRSQWSFLYSGNLDMCVSIRIYQAGCSRWIDMNVAKYGAGITLADLFKIKKDFVGSRPVNLLLERNADDCAHAARLTASFDASAELAVLDMHDGRVVNEEEFHRMGGNDE